MGKKYIIAANWKMNKKFDDSIKFSGTHFDSLVKIAKNDNIQLVICPSFISIYPICKTFKDTKVFVGGQNCSNHTKGSFTGQISSKSLHEAGCKYCIIGHGECRKYLCEDDEIIAQKFIHLIDFDINPILCIGETKEQHDAGKAIEVIKKQLENIINNLNTMLIPDYISPCIAYEPIWSIETGNIPSIDHLETIFAWLKDLLLSLKSNIKVNLLYGGSVDAKNIEHFKGIDNIEGFLIGNTSLNFDKLQQTISKLL